MLTKLNERKNAPKEKEQWEEGGIDKENGYFIKYCGR
jgi:hypothetical protein